MTETVATAVHAAALDSTAGNRAPVLDIVIPVHNEEAGLGDCVRRLDEYLRGGFPFSARITIADNASTDDTLPVAHDLAASVPGVRVVHLDAKGRGRALRAVWERSDARVLAYMDVDLSTDLGALLPLVAPLVSGHSDLAIGTRLDASSRARAISTGTLPLDELRAAIGREPLVPGVPLGMVGHRTDDRSGAAW